MTYEQSKYMNGDETANASFAPKTKPQPQGGNNLTYEQSKYNDEYQKRNNVAQEGINARQQQVLSEKTPDGSQNLMNRIGGAVKNGWEKVKGVFDKDNGDGNSVVNTESTNGDTTGTSGNQDYTSNIGDREKNLYQNVEDNTQDSLTTLEGQGQDVKSKIENVVPRYDKKTWKSLMTDPNLSWDQKAELVLNGLGGALSAGDTGQVQQTDKKVINDAITQQYAQNIADRDRRAMNAAIEPIEAANKEYTDLELRMRDTVAGSYIDRYKAAQDATTKQEVLKQLINDSTVWTSLEPKQKIDMLSYIQALDGNGSLLSMAIQMWAPDLIDKIDRLMRGEKVEDVANEGNETSSQNFSVSEGRTLTQEELEADQKLDEKKRKYVVIPATMGQKPLVVRKGDKVWDADNETKEREAAIKAILENYSLSKQEKLDYARLCDGNLPGKNLGNIGLVEWAVRRQMPDDKGLQGSGAQTEEELANAETIQNSLNSLKNQVGQKRISNAEAVKELQGLKEIANAMGNSPVLKKSYDDAILTYSKDAIRDGLKEMSQSSDTGKERLKKLETLSEAYADVLAGDMDLRKELKNQQIHAINLRDHFEPYQEKLGNSLYYYKSGLKERETTIAPDGSFAIGKALYKPSEYNFRNGGDVEAGNTLDYLKEALTKENVRDYMGIGNLTPQETSKLVKGTPQYKLVSGLVNNNYLKTTKNKDLQKKYNEIIQLYNEWNKIRN